MKSYKYYIITHTPIISRLHYEIEGFRIFHLQLITLIIVTQQRVFWNKIMKKSFDFKKFLSTIFDNFDNFVLIIVIYCKYAA